MVRQLASGISTIQLARIGRLASGFGHIEARELDMLGQLTSGLCSANQLAAAFLASHLVSGARQLYISDFRYFDCPPNHGSFVKPSNVIVLDEPCQDEPIEEL